MTERERFQQWARMAPRYFNTERFFGDDVIWPDREYMDGRTDVAWQAWKAATDAAKTEAIWEGDLNELARLGQETGEYDAEKDD